MEQRIVNLQIKNEYIIGSGVSIGSVGSHDDVLLEMDFRSSAAWAGTTKRAIFSNALGDNRTPIILTTNLLAEGHTEVYLVPVPAEAKDVAGECFLTVEGFVTDGAKEILRIVTEEATFRVLPSKLYANDNPSITPSQVEQLQSEIDEIKDTWGRPTDVQTENAVTKWLNEHPEATTTVKDNSLTVNKMVIGTLGYITPQMFGAKADGITDDSNSIKNAVSYLSDNGTLIFPNGKYYCSISEWGSIIKLQNLKNVVLDLCGSTIIIKPNGNIGYYVIDIVDCENFTIKNGNIIGDRISHDYTTKDGTHEWGYGVFARSLKTSFQSNGCYGKICNLNISQMTGDGIVLSNDFAQGTVEINGCKISHCRRQGISLLQGDRYNIKNTDISFIGESDGINGTAPRTGIDIEPTSGTGVIHNICLENVRISNTDNFSIIAGHGYYMDGLLELNNVSTDNGVDIAYDSNDGKNIECIIRNSSFDFKEGNAITVLGKNATVYNSVIKMNGIIGADANLYNCFVEFIGKSGNFMNVRAYNCIFKNFKMNKKTSDDFVPTIGNTFIDCIFIGWLKNLYMNCTFLGNCTVENLTVPQVITNCYFENGKPDRLIATFVNCYDGKGDLIN